MPFILPPPPRYPSTAESVAAGLLGALHEHQRAQQLQQDHERELEMLNIAKNRAALDAKNIDHEIKVREFKAAQDSALNQAKALEGTPGQVGNISNGVADVTGGAPLDLGAMFSAAQSGAPIPRVNTAGMQPVGMHPTITIPGFEGAPGVAVRPQTQEELQRIKDQDEAAKQGRLLDLFKAEEGVRQSAPLTPFQKATLDQNAQEAKQRSADTRRGQDMASERVSLKPIIRTEQRQGPNGPVTDIVSINPSTGESTVLRSSDKPLSAIEQTQIDRNVGLINTGNNIITSLRDPKIAGQVGPIFGRYNSLNDFIGDPPPEFAKLAAEIDGFAMAAMGAHNFRSAGGAEKLQKMMSQKLTPDALAAKIEGLLQYPQEFINASKRTNGGATVGGTAPKKYHYDAKGNRVEG